MILVDPYTLRVSDELLDDLHDRLRRTRWPQSFPEMGGDYGTTTDYMKGLVDYWLNEFDWRAKEDGINQCPQSKAAVTGNAAPILHISA